MEIMFALIRSEITRDPISEDIYKKINTDALTLIYQISKSHDITNIIAASLQRNGLLDEKSEIGKKYSKQMLLSIYRYEKIKYELELLCDVLSENKIAFMPLKGSVIRKFYPEPWLRTSCDIDILIHKQDIDLVCNILETKLSYGQKEVCPHDISYFSSSETHLELHYDLIENQQANNASEVLTKAWDDAANVNYKYLMSAEMLCFYHVAHIAKHIQEGGCGIRPIIDLWIMNKELHYDLEKLEKYLEEADLLVFSNNIFALLSYWFENGVADDHILALSKFVVDGGVYGNLSNRVSVLQNKSGGKLKYLFSRIFVPYSRLIFYYPILKKHKFLMPFYQVKRWFTIITKRKFKAKVKELNINNSMTKEQQQKTKQLFVDLHLY